jgi:hypothetical protein
MGFVTMGISFLMVSVRSDKVSVETILVTKTHSRPDLLWKKLTFLRC